MRLRFSNNTTWAWEDEDALHVRYGYLGADERILKVQAEVASATKKMKHPAKKGECIYRVWRGTNEVDSSASSKRRALALDAELDPEQATLVASAMQHDVACKGGRGGPIESSQEKAAPAPKKKAKKAASAAKTPSLQKDFAKSEKDVQGLVKKLQRSWEGLTAIKDPLRSDEGLILELKERLDECMVTYRALVEAKLSSTFDEVRANELLASAMDHSVTASGAIQSAQLRLKQLAKKK